MAANLSGNLICAIGEAASQSGSQQPVATKHSSKSQRPSAHRKSLKLAVCVCLLAAAAAMFGQSVCFDFINFDDPGYVYENPPVVAGLNARSVRWAFTQIHMENWHPLTWVSHMTDCQLYGLRPGGHHLTSVALHAATAILLFLLLAEMTGALWPSALAAAIFVIHPLRAESVVWVAERKDVLSGLFFMLTLAAYVRYVRLPFSLARYLTVLALFACGLMAKQMLVTLPCVLLLLDGWPLGRLVAAFPDELPDSPGMPATRRKFLSLDPKVLWEKVPFFFLSAAACCVTLSAQGKAILGNFPLSTRLANAIVAYTKYLGQFFIPFDLAAFYPHPGGSLPAWKIVGSLGVLLAISILAIRQRRDYPYLLVGWLWFLGMLAPVIGLVQVGLQGMANRYTYLPQIGLCIALAWGAADLGQALSVSRRAKASGALLVLAALFTCGLREVSYWQNSETIWRRALVCTTENWMAHLNLANALASQGKLEEAVAHYDTVLKILPDCVDAHNNLGNALSRQGKDVEASIHYQAVLEIKPEHAPAHFNLANSLVARGKLNEAIAHYRETLRIVPGLPAAQLRLVDALAAQPNLEAAIAECQRAIEGPEALKSPELAGALWERLTSFQRASRP